MEAFNLKDLLGEKYEQVEEELNKIDWCECGDTEHYYVEEENCWRCRECGKIVQKG